jgi:hypothetical protein
MKSYARHRLRQLSITHYPLLLALASLTRLALAQTPPPPAPIYPLLPHSDTEFAHDLLRLNQPSLIASELRNSTGTPAENLWKAESILATWESAPASKIDRAASQRAYLIALPAYLDSQSAGIDGVWALDHAKFLFSRFSESLLNRMEYWANSPKDRAALAPIAALGDRLLTQATASLTAGMHAAETRTPFDEAAYTRDFNATAEIEYYGAWAAYFRAMAMDPADPARKDILTGAATLLGKWADDPQDNGVNNQSLLLRGKVESEAGDYDAAAADLTRAAQNAAAPAWVRYQARYQLVVTRLRAGTFDAANTELAYFKKSLPANNLDAQMSTEMLAYRVAWAEAQTHAGTEKSQAEAAALQILSTIIQRDPPFRGLVYEQLSAQIPDDANPKTLLPLQQLAVAYMHSEGQTGDTPDSQAELTQAAAAAAAVHDNPAAAPADKLEATFLAGVTNALLKNTKAAARYNVEFAEQAPQDARAKPLLDLALQQIGELRKSAAATGKTDPALAELEGRALALATNNFQDTRWRYAQARTLEDAGKLADAAKIFSEIPADDKNYLDARFRLVAIATTRFNALPAAAPAPDVQAAAKDLFAACAQFLSLLDNPPPSIDPETLARAKTYRLDIWLIETSTALNPLVKQPDLALDRLTKLDAEKSQLNPAQQEALLRYRIQAYQLAGQPEKAFATVQAYAKSHGTDANQLIRTMAYSTLQEISAAEKTDPDHAKELARYVIKLLDPLIEAASKDPAQQSAAYDYQKLQSDMLMRAGQFADAQALAAKLKTQRPDDLFNYMTDARALFEQARDHADPKLYAQASEEFTRILPQVPNGSQSFWECWLRILQSKEALGGPDAASSITKSLNDLHAGFGDKIGGDVYKEEFATLLTRFSNGK